MTKVATPAQEVWGKRACTRSPAITVSKVAASEIGAPLCLSRDGLLPTTSWRELGNVKMFDNVSKVRSGEAPTRRVERST